MKVPPRTQLEETGSVLGKDKSFHFSHSQTHLLLLLLGRFDDSRVGLPRLAEVVEEGQGVDQEGQVDRGEGQMCSQMLRKTLVRHPSA